MAADVKFVLGDTLPTYYDAAIAIFSVTRKINCAKMDNTLKNYADALINMWEKSFGGSTYVMARNSVLKRLEKLVHHYYNNVATKLNRTTSKHGEVHKPVSERTLNKQWKNSYITVRLKVDFLDSLLDIGRETENLTWREKVFYHDQKGARVCRLSHEIDGEWVQEQLKIIEQQKEDSLLLEHQEHIESNDEGSDNEVADGLLNISSVSSNRSGLV